MNLWFVRQQRYLFNPVLLFKTKINMTSHNCTVLKSHMTLVQMVVCIYPMTIGCRRWDKIIKNLKVYWKIINWKLFQVWEKLTIQKVSLLTDMLSAKQGWSSFFTFIYSCFSQHFFHYHPPRRDFSKHFFPNRLHKLLISQTYYLLWLYTYLCVMHLKSKIFCTFTQEQFLTLQECSHAIKSAWYTSCNKLWWWCGNKKAIELINTHSIFVFKEPSQMLSWAQYDI